jgi:peptidyl-prolyl cis-trans isomerase C
MNIAFHPIQSLSVLILAVVLAVPGAALAQAPAGDTVLISNSFAKVTRAEYDAELLKLPADLRTGFANNPRRVNDLLARMLVQKSLAAQGRAAKVDTTPEAALRIELEVDRVVGQMFIESIEAKAIAEFDANPARFEQRAREAFLLDRAKYTTPEQVSATHILFDTKKHTSDEAKKLAQDARAKLVAGADMAQLAKELSDDPSAATNGGSLGWFAQKDMDPAFGAAAFALKNPGDLSEPVMSQYGWHVIRLDGKRPAVVPTFEQARDTIMAELKKRYVEEKTEDAVAATRRDPKTEVNREAVDALTPKVDANAVRRALEAVPMGAAPAAPK